MANYNPHSAQILGEEWVPIRDENVAFSPSVNAVELGHSFTLDASRQVRDARFYANTLPAPAVAYQTALFGIYPYGLEDQSGPISQVMIPVSNGGVTGTGLAIAGASTVAEALLLSGDGKYIIADGTNVSPTNLVMFFNTGQYSQLLQGKRILNVSLLYVGWARDINSSNITIPFVDPSPLTPATVFRLTNDAASQTITYSRFFGANTGNLWDLNTSIPPSSGDPAYGAREAVLNLGDVNLWWSTAVAPSATTDVMPYRYADLLRFDASSANRINSRVIFQVPNNNGANTQIFIDYFAMRVIYCEEQRVVYGGRRNGFGNLNYGANPVTLRNPSHTADPILAAGRYVQTLSWVNPGDIDFGAGTVSEFPDLNGLRRLYEIPSFNGVQLNIPFPPEERLGDVFTSEVTAVLPQLSLHASGGALTEPHVYGRQVAAQVYGANTATQDIYDDISGVNAVYPQVRYYARRFGDTTIPLTLTGVGAFSGSSASITVSDFDALSEIIDGWKEVTLRFGTPPTMGAAAGSPAWTWSAVAETAGNRWEVMGASAPAVSGVPGNLLHLAAQQLSGATYQPPAGATNELTWMPQGIGSPYVSGASADATSDAVLIFSQDPPQVTGVSLTAQTQTVTGIGFDCGSLPCCIPSGIAYQQIQWSATSLPSTGFGAYQLQRWDSVTGGDFETIMLATNPALVSFNDYEARVGITSVYRIRSLNALNFAGSWSTYVSGAPPTPGVTGGCADSTGALIFTSNGAQSGIYNAAYVMQWEGAPSEDFELPEASMVQYQPIYGRDGAVAFHGTERGLETFSRTLLLQAAAIDPKRLADAKTIRDLAWADLPYVCVRDDVGDRWFANVRVPTVAVRHNRTKYMARVDIVETSVCPYPVNP